MSILLLWLEGPLQSWGADSRYGNRTTLPFPTRSGVLGLLCCAAGRGGEQRDWLAHMAATGGQAVLAYARKEKERIVRQPLLTDFQMVGSGYDQTDPWQDLLVPKTSEGKKPVGSGSKMTYRQYLQDMAFACLLSLPENDALQLQSALEHPVWEISLGRRNCPPAAPVGRGVFAGLPEALAAAEKLAGEDRGLVLSVYEGACPDGSEEACFGSHEAFRDVEVWTLNDVPRCFGPRKEYGDRQVTVYYW